MDIYTQTQKLLSSMPTISDWDEMQAVIERLSSGKPPDWQLPVLGCESVGGKRENAVPAVAATACLLISIVLVDDLLDDDPRGEYHRIGAPATANLALAFQAAGMEAIAQSEVSSSVKIAVIGSLNQMMLATAFGQYKDVQNPADEEAYWQLIRGKSSPFFGAALHVGAFFGGAPHDIAEQLKQFGFIYGEMIQIHDDLNDAMAVPANPDWILGRSPLPILYAQVVEHPDRSRFLDLRKNISNPDALSEAQSILIHCGAVSYCVDQLLRRYQSARDILENISLVNREGLEGLLDEVIQPVRKLLATIGVDQPEAFLPSTDPFTQNAAIDLEK